MSSPKKYLGLAGFILASEFVGVSGSFVTISAIPTWYAGITKPFFAPPNWVFGPVWTTLYALIGISFWIIWQSKPSKLKKRAVYWFILQMALNAVWTPIFFGLKNPEFALFVITALWISIFQTIRFFSRITKSAGYLLIPYILWVSFATLLNAAIAWLN